MEIVKLTKINKYYKTASPSLHALKDISLTINKGDYVSFMGSSGSGKTTLLDILGCLSTPSSGEYYLDGERVDALDHKEIATVRNRKIGFVFQNFNLIPKYTLLENVELPLTYAGLKKQERKKQALDVLASVGLSSMEMRLPNQISGGERQRVAIARALVNNPSIILADEPTGNLDSRTGETILTLFEDLHRKGHTIIMVTHDPQVAKLSAVSYFIRDGKLNPSKSG